jgi:hypothetical protein
MEIHGPRMLDHQRMGQRGWQISGNGQRAARDPPGRVGEQELAEPDDVARYEKYLELLRKASRTGRDAATVIQRSLESLR